MLLVAPAGGTHREGHVFFITVDITVDEDTVGLLKPSHHLESMDIFGD
jgi:hypothetical protein